MQLKKTNYSLGNNLNTKNIATPIERKYRGIANKVWLLTTPIKKVKPNILDALPVHHVKSLSAVDNAGSQPY